MLCFRIRPNGMSSALKPVLTPPGAQNPAAASQINKSVHQQGGIPSYPQPISHVPQNLVNMAHNVSNTPPAHVNTTTNHYSQTVPTHTTTSSNSSPSQAGGTYTSSSKNIGFNNAGYPGGVSNSLKISNTVPSTQSLPATQHSTQAPTPVTSPSEEASVPEKPQSNGTADPKNVLKPELVSNHVTPAVKEKPSQPSIAEKPKHSPEKPSAANLGMCSHSSCALASKYYLGYTL